MNKLKVCMIGFESNNIIAFYRKTKDSPSWVSMNAREVRRYWIEIFYKRLPSMVDKTIEIYEEL